jgi:tetratricopeptide (TPR) repeat protein
MDESIRWLHQKGKEAFQARDFDAAFKHLTELTREVVTFADVWNMLGQIHHHRGELGPAIDCFEKALRINHRYAEAQFNLAIAYSEIGEYEKAQKLYDVAAGAPEIGDGRIKDPMVKARLANLHADLGDLYHGLGVFDDAIREYEKALSLRPDFPDIRTRMAQSLFDAERKDEAVIQLQLLKQARPDYLAARVALGVFLFSTGKLDEALAEWKAILERDPNHERAKMYLRLAAKSKKW